MKYLSWLMLLLDLVSLVPPKAVERIAGRNNPVIVRSDSELASAIRDARPGTMIKLDSTVVFSNLVVPDGVSGINFEPTGDRVTIVSMGGLPAAAVGLKCVDIRFFSIDFLAKSDCVIVVRVGYDASGSREAKTIEELPNRVEFSECRISGSPESNVRIGLLGNARNLVVNKCAITEVHTAGIESQGLIVTNSPGPFDLSDNFIEASGINVLFGGSVPTIPGLQIADIYFHGNYCSKNLQWKGRYLVKNLFEIKGGVRAKVVDNVFTNCWEDSQNGTAILFTVRDGSTISDVSFESNLVSNVGGGVLVTSVDNLGNTSVPTARILFRRNVWKDIGGLQGTGWVYAFASPNGRTIEGVEIDGDVAFHHDSNPRAIVGFEGRYPAVNGLEISKCVFSNGRYGIIGTGTSPGQPTLSTWVTGVVDIRGNRVLGGTDSEWPAGNRVIH